MIYRYGTYFIESPIPCTTCIPIPKTHYQIIDYYFVVIHSLAVFSNHISWQHPSPTEGDDEIFLSIGQYNGDYILHFPDVASFVVSPADKTITCHVEDGTPENTITHLLLDQVLPRVLTLSGHRPLHASAVTIHGGLVAFLGESGRGKSTLALSFDTAGYTAVTDDVLFLEHENDVYTGYAPYAGLRLWDDSISSILKHKVGIDVCHYNGKQRVNTATAIVENLPIHALIVLGEPNETNEIQLHRMSPLEAVTHLTSGKFRLDNNKDSLAEELDFFATFANTIPFYHLTYPRDYTALQQVQHHIFRLFKD